MISFREDLQKMVDRGCGEPNCHDDVHGEAFIHPVCHVGASLEVVYLSNVGTLEMRCKQCKSHVLTVLVPFFHYPRAETPAKPRVKEDIKAA